MKKDDFWAFFALLGGGAAFCLRLAHLRTGFEPNTGLPISGICRAWLPPAFLLALAAVFFLRSRRLPSKRTGFPASFHSASLPFLPVAAIGAALVLLSGGWEIFHALTSPVPAPAELALGVCSVLSFPCLLAALFAVRRSQDGRLAKLLLLLVAALTLRVILAYRANSVNPVLSAYYPNLLALSALILAFFHLTAFAFQDGSARRFFWSAAMAVVLGGMAQADALALSVRLLYSGCGLTLLGFLGMLRSAAQTTPEA